MSSDNIALIQGLDIERMQGLLPAAHSPKPDQPADVGRNAPAAAHGQNVPPDPASEAEEVKKYESAVSQISDFVQNFQRDLLFSIDKDSDRLVVKVVDSKTQEVIRQIPSEETLRIARNLDSPESLIFREQA